MTTNKTKEVKCCNCNKEITISQKVVWEEDICEECNV